MRKILFPTFIRFIWAFVPVCTYAMATETQSLLKLFHRSPGWLEEQQSVRLTLTVCPAENVTVWLLYRIGDSEWRRLLARPSTVTGQQQVFEVILPSFRRWSKINYYWQVRCPGHRAVYHPARGAANPLRLFVKGHVPRQVLLAHVVLMFAALGVMGLCSILAAAALAWPGIFSAVAVSARWGTLLLAFGGLVLGPVVAYLHLGIAWEGFPFGSDLTDTKTELLFLYWLGFAIWLIIRVKKKDTRSRTRLYALLIALLGSAATAFCYFMLPH